MDRIGVIFGGKSGEHEVSLLSATSVIKEINTEKHEIVMIGITKDGVWKHFDGPVECIADGSWERWSEPFAISELKAKIDFALPILHGPFGELLPLYIGHVQRRLDDLRAEFQRCLRRQLFQALQMVQHLNGGVHAVDVDAVNHGGLANVFDRNVDLFFAAVSCGHAHGEHTVHAAYLAR